MIAQQVAKKYSTALFLSAGRRGLLDEAYTQFTDLKTVLRTDPALVKFLSSPKIEEEQKLDLLHRVFGERMQRLFLEFLIVLVRKRRAMYLVHVIDAFDLMVERHKGIVRATATTAVPLSGDEEKRLIERLSAKSGKKIELERKIDPRLIGGMVVRVGDEMIDGSVRYGLVKLEERLNHIKVH
ncbi:MAG: ATP synthase F1 subunit delta [candidate division Zixibacteria bacterium]|nr:ATP synthase F1 subunit delta [candidate division Zixibacteria bacterium]